MLRALGLIRPGARILDVGCGCGRLPRVLLDDPIARYDGFDRHPGMIDWCDLHFTPVADRFRFHYFDLRSAYESLDGASGTFGVREFRFPFASRSFDTIVASSVFTHLPLEEIEAYLERIAGWLSPGGEALVSVFHETGPPRWDGLGFYLSPEDFARAAAAVGLSVENPFTTRFGALHNWYRLRGVGSLSS